MSPGGVVEQPVELALQLAQAAGDFAATALVFVAQLLQLVREVERRQYGDAIAAAGQTVDTMGDGVRGMARGSVVVILSDGWDRGDPKILEAEVRRIQLQARRLVWINPRPMSVDQQPLAIGMRAAMPYIDDFVPGHDPRAVAGAQVQTAEGETWTGDAGYDLDQVLTTEDLVSGENVFFSATGVTDGDLLRGVRFFGGGIRTSSLFMSLKKKLPFHGMTPHVMGELGTTPSLSNGLNLAISRPCRSRSALAARTSSTVG